MLKITSVGYIIKMSHQGIGIPFAKNYIFLCLFIIGSLIGIIVASSIISGIIVLVLLAWLFSLVIVYINQGMVQFSGTWLFFIVYTIVLIPGSVMFWLKTGDIELLLISVIG